ncbi:MAG TPA: DUF4403 family protein [Pseudolabrys sp.]
MLDRIIYIVTAPVRLFGSSRTFRLTLGAICVVGLFFVATLWALDSFLPHDNDAKKAVAKLPQMPPLPPVTRASYVIAPVAISIPAIRASLDNAAPRDLASNNNNPVSNLLSKANIGMTIKRGSMLMSGRPNELTATIPLNGELQLTGQIAGVAGNLTSGITGLLNGALGKDIGKLTNQVLDQKAEIKGQVTVVARPALTANWRLEPNLSAQVSLSDSAVSIAGLKLNVSNEAKPLIDRATNEQVSALSNRLRADPFIERSAREQWAKMCRSIPLGGGDTGLPTLWLEMRPVRAAAAQPQVDTRNLTLTVGVQAETKIVPTQTKPDCPFPAALELVPPMDNGKLAIGVPIDLPFTDLTKLLNAQLKGRHFPEDGSAAVDAEVLSASLAAAGERILISLRVKAKEKKSWFGFGANATINIWGKPVLDQQNQILRLTDLEVAVESDAAYGLLNAAARAATPYLQDALAENAKIDLKPFAADALKKITVALADFQKDSAGVKVDAAVNDLRMTGIEFDSNTLRVIAEAAGTARVAVTELPRL